MTNLTRRLYLVTPFLDEIQDRIIENYASAGYACVAERHLHDRVGFSFSQVPDRDIAELIRAVAADRPEAITVFCTNFQGATVVDELERELDIPIYDTVAVTAWKCLSMAGVDAARVSGWGRLFGELA